MSQQQLTSITSFVVIAALLLALPMAFAAAPSGHRAVQAHHAHRIDRSGRRQVGKASIYARKFAGRRMADGHRMNPRDGNAASKVLPLGTVAKVTNLETGKSTVVTIQDRGPYVRGRIVDLSPGAAARIGLAKKKGVAPVEVAPIAVPLPDGSVKPGEGAHDAVAQSQDALAQTP
ncbi:MAG TPA: septal ring lytic transglycosylase RlpA family protein [Ramlibacter sp.]|nr:septal ring lytic transglycosylase RlpA family protein [Ramlibacter sp.]